MKYIVQAAVGDYRQSVMQRLVEVLGNEFCVLSGLSYFEESTKTAIDIGSNLIVIKNYFFLSRRFLLQPSAVMPAIKAHYLILELNPRILSVWLIILIRKLLGKKTVLWGHAWPRAGMHSPTDKLRNVMRKLADGILVYTHTQKAELADRMPGKKIVVAPNSLYSNSEMYFEQQERLNFIYVGRLVDSKKPRLLIRAFYESKLFEFGAKLIIVGAGPESEPCRQLAAELCINDAVVFTGHVSDLTQLRKLYSGCIASVSPGYVGLSITQSFSFGTPMIISKDERHSPEIEAAAIGENSVFFATDSEGDLAKKLRSFWDDRVSWAAKAETIVLDCKNRYSSEIMADGIIEAFNLCK